MRPFALTFTQADNDLVTTSVAQGASVAPCFFALILTPQPNRG
jgi:hypothetical protein